MAFRVVISFWAIVFTTLAAIAVVVIANHDRRMDRGLAIAQANAQVNVQATAHVASQEFSVTP